MDNDLVQYSGCWRDSYMTGLGIFSESRGRTVAGVFKENKAYGPGCIVFASGALYLGELNGSKREGKGRYTPKVCCCW